ARLPVRGRGMIEINDRVRIPEGEYEWSFVRSGGPGGQNVNKVASKAVLRWHLATSTSLPEEAKARLASHQRRRVTGEGDFVVTSQRYRDQERNREDCIAKLRAILAAALPVPIPPRPTTPTHRSPHA